MKFQFTKDEALAIYKVAKMMAEADGVVLHKELKGIEDGMDRLSIKGEEFDHVVLAGEKLPAIDALVTLSKMEDQKKKYVSSFLGYFISVDDDIADVELALWTFIVKVANLPKMNIRQAVEIYGRF